MVGKATILSLYKSLHREAQQFSSYNLKMYAQRRIRDSFKEYKNVESNKILDAVAFAKKNLEVIRRQAAVSQLYSSDKLIIEKEDRF